MPLTFRDAPAFWRETLAVTAGALAVGLAAPLATGVPLDVAAASAALLGGSIGAALTRERPASAFLRGVVGVVGGTLAALGSAALATRFGVGATGVALGGGLGALTIASLLGSDEDARGHGLAQAAGLATAVGTGVVGVHALAHIASFAQSTSASPTLTSATMAAGMGLWIAAAAGVRRVQRVRDAIVVRGEEVLVALADPVRAKVIDALQAYAEMHEALAKGGMAPDTVGDAKMHARRLMEALLETASTWKQIERDVKSPRLRALDDKLADLERRTELTTDAVTLGHLARAGQALRAQKSALEGLKVGAVRAEAALDAQMALLERLRLAIAQHRISDRERFAVELSAVADQVTLLSDDLESLSAAIAEAESFSDRRMLADVERAGRRALDALTVEASDGEPAVEREQREQETAPTKR